MRQMTRRRRDLIAGSSPFDPVFSKNTWQQIIAACQAKTIPDTWQVGDSKLMTIDGEEHQIDIIGKDHDWYLVDGAMAVRALYKEAAAGNGSGTVYPMREFTFLLCAEEVFGTYGSYNSKGEGTQYEYYKNGGSTIKTGPNGSAATWWLRSAYEGNAAWFCEVLPSGYLSADNASARHNISFGFCF